MIVGRDYGWMEEQWKYAGCQEVLVDVVWF